MTTWTTAARDPKGADARVTCAPSSRSTVVLVAEKQYGAAAAAAAVATVSVQEQRESWMVDYRPQAPMNTTSHVNSWQTGV